ncbi:hypothetical protein JTB14_032223 [Gonioctena quinquepunctata]|nr:hypothetical protein JTB14_032223 [Gonioctena quinquepunctata]
MPDSSLLDPKKKSQIRNNQKKLEVPILEELTRALLKFYKDISAHDLRVKFNNFILKWNNLRLSINDVYNVRKISHLCENSREMEEDDNIIKKKKIMKIICVNANHAKIV